ncbi:MAG: glutamate mutase L, partial [Planctomycetota bacterium]|nr:glutamate mutase L [Planctomycetota bacterium]
IPQTLESLLFEQAVAREALRLAYEQHKDFATTLKGVQQQRTVGDTFSQQASGQTIVNNMTLDLLVASGGVLSHAPRMSQTAAMLVDAFQPEGITTLAKDSIFMMPHLGVLSQVHPEAAVQVFERDCLVYLGTCIAPAGIGKPGKPCFEYQVTGDEINENGQVLFGELKLLPLADGATATATIEPAKGFDAGEGPGKRIEREIRGGTVGVLLDGRGRPLELPKDRDACREAVVTWNQVQGLAELN